MDQHEIKKAFAIRAIKRARILKDKIKALGNIGIDIPELEYCVDMLLDVPAVLFAQGDPQFDNIVEFTVHHIYTDHQQTDESFIQNVIDLNYVIYPHPEKDLTLILLSLSAMTTPDEVANIINVINTKNRFTFGEILPDNIQVFTREEMAADGWFPEPIFPI